MKAFLSSTIAAAGLPCSHTGGWVRHMVHVYARSVLNECVAESQRGEGGVYISLPTSRPRLQGKDARAVDAARALLRRQRVGAVRLRRAGHQG